MHSIHLTQVFRVTSPRTFDECDRLMEALIDLEDEHVRDAAVSADTARGVVVVEVIASGPDRTAAEIAGLSRIYDALTDVVGVQVVSEIASQRRVEELVPA